MTTVNLDEKNRNELISALAAALRWKASCADDYTGDVYKQETIARLIETLSNVPE